MKETKLIIYTCLDCPYYRYHAKWCSRLNRGFISAEQIDNIFVEPPDDCPLPNVEE